MSSEVEDVNVGYVREYRAGDEVALAPRLRDADIRDIRTRTEIPIVDVLRGSGEISSPSCSIIGNTEEVEGMFGIVDEGNGFGRVWLLGSDALVRKPLVTQFLREVPRYLELLERPYQITGNIIDSRNLVHIRWLKFNGYTFIADHVDAGLHGERLLEFVKIKE